MHRNFYASIYHTLTQHPAQELLVWPGAQGPTSYSGQDLLSRVQQWQAALRKPGLQPGQSVLLLLPVGPELVCALLAVMALGAVPVLPPATAKPLTLLALLRRNGIRTVAAAPELSRRIGWLAKTLGLRLVASTSASATTITAEAPASVADTLPALVSHSSGSTGRPKAIRRSHAVLAAQHAVLKEVFPPWAGQRDFPLFPNILLHNLSLGVVSVLPDVPWGHLADLDPARVVRQLQASQAETLTGNVFYFAKLCRHLEQQPTPLPAVRAVGVGGSPVPESLLCRLRACFPGVAVYVIYGSSEAEPIAVRHVTTATDPRGGYCVGKVPAGISCRIHPLGYTELATGRYAVGEICVQGAHVAAAPGTWLPTGDFGYFDQHGQLWLTGRQGNEALHQGVQHYQLENVLSQVAGVDRVAARATASGFDIHFEGPAAEAALRRVLAEHFPAGLCNRLMRRRHLPVDGRHLSKILYAQLR